MDKNRQKRPKWTKWPKLPKMVKTVKDQSKERYNCHKPPKQLQKG